MSFGDLSKTHGQNLKTSAQLFQIILYSNTEYKESLKRRTMRLSLFRSPNENYNLKFKNLKNISIT